MVNLADVADPTVLVADDDRGCRRAVREALETVGIRTYPASSGRRAIAVIRRRRVHVGIFDLHMPEMSGLDAIRFLRQERIYVPVIVMTSDPTGGLEERALSEGAVSLLLKPIDLGVIRDAVRVAFEKYV
ncbi:MAG: response regulator [Planctomycetes bacterium]|nr:response regulator [Planctomycetota bacterium]